MAGAREIERKFSRFRARIVVETLLIAGLVSAFPAMAAAAADPFRVGEAIAAPDWLSISGTQRIRYETLEGQFRAAGAGGDQLLSLRTTLALKATRGAFSFNAEIWDARAYLADDGTPISNGFVNAAEFVQMNVAATLDDAAGAGSSLALTAGRFTLDLGSRRLVARNRFRMTTNAFTGLLGDLKWASGERLVAFYSLPQRRLPSEKASLRENEVKFDREDFNQQFFGAFFSKAFSDRFTGEIYAFRLHERDAPGFASADRRLTTIGSRYFLSPETGAVDFEIEGAIQFGDRGSTALTADFAPLDVFASFSHAEIGFSFDHPMKPRLALAFDYASGDKDPNDGKYNRFDQLFGPRRHDLGPLGLHGEIDRANLVAPGVRLSAQPAADVTVFVHYLAAILDEGRDSFGITGIRDASGTSGGFGAHQIEAAARWSLLPGNASVEVGGAYVANGKFLNRAPNATGEGDTRYLYAELNLAF